MARDSLRACLARVVDGINVGPGQPGIRQRVPCAFCLDLQLGQGARPAP
jgi:hypothetical protein